MKRANVLSAAAVVAALVTSLTGSLAASASVPEPVAAVAAAAVTAPVSDDAGASSIPLRSMPVLAAPEPHGPLTRWTVRPGQSLSAIAASAYGSASLWPALWWVNKAHVRNPNIITAGQVLKLSRWHPAAAWLDHAALRAIPAPPAPRVTVVSYRPNAAASPVGTWHAASNSSRSYGSYGNVSPNSYSGFERCVIARESGGNSQVMNSSGHYGLFQFSASTWQAYGGSAASFGHASVAQQQAVFANAMAQGGQSNWSPYDGC